MRPRRHLQALKPKPSRHPHPQSVGPFKTLGASGTKPVKPQSPCLRSASELLLALSSAYSSCRRKLIDLGSITRIHFGALKLLGPGPWAFFSGKAWISMGSWWRIPWLQTQPFVLGCLRRTARCLLLHA